MNWLLVIILGMTGIAYVYLFFEGVGSLTKLKWWKWWK